MEVGQASQATRTCIRTRIKSDCLLLKPARLDCGGPSPLQDWRTQADSREAQLCTRQSPATIGWYHLCRMLLDLLTGVLEHNRFVLTQFLYFCTVSSPNVRRRCILNHLMRF